MEGERAESAESAMQKNDMRKVRILRIPTILSANFYEDQKRTRLEREWWSDHKILKSFKIFAYIKKKYYLCSGKQNNSFHWVKILSVLSKNLKYDATYLFWNDYEAIKWTKKVHSLKELFT